MLKLPKPRQNSSGQDPEEFRLSLVGHLEELRTRIIRCLAIYVVAWIVTWIIEEKPRTYLTTNGLEAIRRVVPKDIIVKEVITDSSDIFMVPMKFSAMLALIVALPFIILQLWGFIAPGLKPKEQAPFRKLGPISLTLFLVGAGFAYVILPSAYAWFGSFQYKFPKADILQEVGKMAFFSLKTILAFGIGFQLPLVVYILGALNLLSAKTLLKYWRHSTLVIFIMSAMLTPSNDPGTMLMMAVPLTILFMISVQAVKLVQRKKGKEEFLWDAESRLAEEKAEAEQEIYYPIDEPARTSYQPAIPEETEAVSNEPRP